MGYPSRGKGSNYGNQRQRSGNKFSSHSSKSTFKSVPSFVTPDDSVWVTIRGTHVLIKDGETASQAFKRTTGKDLSEPEKKIYDKPDGDNAKSINKGNDKGSGAGDKTNMQGTATQPQKDLVKNLINKNAYKKSLVPDGRYMGDAHKTMMGNLDSLDNDEASDVISFLRSSDMDINAALNDDYGIASAKRAAKIIKTKLWKGLP